MSERRIIDCEALYARTRLSPNDFRAVQAWPRANNIKPDDVPVPSEMAIEDSAIGMVIRYTAYLTNADGCRYVDPDAPERGAATANRTALLRLAPPADWLTPTGGER